MHAGQCFGPVNRGLFRVHLRGREKGGRVGRMAAIGQILLKLGFEAADLVQRTLNVQPRHRYADVGNNRHL